MYARYLEENITWCCNCWRRVLTTEDFLYNDDQYEYGFALYLKAVTVLS